MVNLVPIFICVVLPIAVVAIGAWEKVNADNKRAEVILRAIETDNTIDADKLAESLKKPRRTPREVLNLRLLRGCIFSFMGLGLIIVAIISLLNDCTITDDPVCVPLVFGSASLAIGLSYLIVYFMTRHDVMNDK